MANNGVTIRTTTYKRQLTYVATLECGHDIKLRNEPMPNARFICRSGLGCGYRVAWVSWTRTDKDNWTPTFAKHLRK